MLLHHIFSLSLSSSLSLHTDDRDFNSTSFLITFPADEGLPIPTVTVDAPIQIFDDDVDEAESQFFIVYLEVFSAVKEEIVELATILSSCRIVDNDGEKNDSVGLSCGGAGWEGEPNTRGLCMLQIFRRNCQ